MNFYRLKWKTFLKFKFPCFISLNLKFSLLRFRMRILRTQMSWAALIVGRWTSNGGQLSKCGSLLSRKREFSHQKYVHSKKFLWFYNNHWVINSRSDGFRSDRFFKWQSFLIKIFRSDWFSKWSILEVTDFAKCLIVQTGRHSLRT